MTVLTDLPFVEPECCSGCCYCWTFPVNGGCNVTASTWLTWFLDGSRLATRARPLLQTAIMLDRHGCRCVADHGRRRKSRRCCWSRSPWATRRQQRRAETNRDDPGPFKSCGSHAVVGTSGTGGWRRTARHSERVSSYGAVRRIVQPAWSSVHLRSCLVKLYGASPLPIKARELRHGRVKGRLS